MHKISLPKEQAKYIKEVLGVDRLYLSTSLEEQRADEKSWSVWKRFSDANWLVLVDLSAEQISSEEEELLSKMLSATKVPEQHINVFLLPPQAEVTAKLRKEIFKYKKVLALGTKSHAALAGATKDFPMQKLESFFKQSFVGTYSLSQLSSGPQFKKETWALMKGLIQA
jgi:hypothetical protein